MIVSSPIRSADSVPQAHMRRFAWTATANWRFCLVRTLLSLVRALMRAANSEKRGRAECLNGPTVSSAEGTMLTLSPSKKYLVFFRFSAAAAAAPGELVDACRLAGSARVDYCRVFRVLLTPRVEGTVCTFCCLPS